MTNLETVGNVEFPANEAVLAFYFGEIPFFKSRYSSTGGCLAIAKLDTGEVLVGDSKDPSQTPLRYTSPEWNAFLRGAMAGEFGQPTK